jgi:hypothetical protein
MREIVVWLSPRRAASVQVNQWAAFSDIADAYLEARLDSNLGSCGFTMGVMEPDLGVSVNRELLMGHWPIRCRTASSSPMPISL